MNESEKESVLNVQAANDKVKHLRLVKYLLYVLLAVVVGMLLILFS